MKCEICQDLGMHHGQICECITGRREPPTVEGAVEMLKRMFGMEDKIDKRSNQEERQ